VRSLLNIAHVQGDRLVTDLTLDDWQALYAAWQLWLTCLEQQQFNPHLEVKGYGLIDKLPNSKNPLIVNNFCDRYYSQQTAQVAFQQLHQQLSQAIQNQLTKLNIKQTEFLERLKLAALADDFKNKADLLMANSQLWRVGMTEIQLPDFHSNKLMAIALDPTQNAIQNAQSLYKKHQKQKRAVLAIAPLLEAVQQEIAYLEQVATAVNLLEQSDLAALQEIRLELGQQGYLKIAEEYTPKHKSANGLSKNPLKNSAKNQTPNKGRSNKSHKPKMPKSKQEDSPNCHQFLTPNGFEVLVGRNNYQNDLLSFRIAGEYDLWLHAQEISGSHVLLRLPAGAIAEDIDLQTAADYAAYYSRARLSDRVPVVCTMPRYVFKPKGAKPGMVVYTHEKIIWGQPTAIAIPKS
jgi:predicted ribosome quality control (RQC) complex YloA/Tae2 family protein